MTRRWSLSAMGCSARASPAPRAHPMKSPTRRAVAAAAPIRRKLRRVTWATGPDYSVAGRRRIQWPGLRQEVAMALPPAEFAAALLREAKETHPWLHHRLFRMLWDGRLTPAQLRDVIRQQGCFFLDTLRHAAWKIISVGGYSPTFDDLERQRALIPLVVEEGGEDMVGGKTTAHAYLFIRLAEGLGISRDTLFATDYLPTTIIEKNELFLLQRSSTVEALCGGNLATESINPIHMGRTAEALEKHYGVPRAALEFYHVHMEVEDEHAARAVTILEKIAVTDEEQSRGRLALRRALTARRLCADGMLQAFVGGHDANP